MAVNYFIGECNAILKRCLESDEFQNRLPVAVMCISHVMSGFRKWQRDILLNLFDGNWFRTLMDHWLIP